MRAANEYRVSAARAASAHRRLPALDRHVLLDDLRASWNRAFSLIELLIVVGLIGTIAAIALPIYMDALDKARVGRSIGDIAGMSSDISLFWIDNGRHPANLTEVGWGGTLDPYGAPYEYLNIADGGKGGGKGKGGGGGSSGGRKDRFLVPVNSDFDLYSMGKDGKSVLPFTAKASHDDIVREPRGPGNIERVNEQIRKGDSQSSAQGPGPTRLRLGLGFNVAKPFQTLPATGASSCRMVW